MSGNIEAVNIWVHVQTQWRVGAFGRAGLDYPAVRAEARALGLYMSHGLMRKMQAMEKYYLKKKDTGKNDQPGGQGDDPGDEKAV